jgi:hypothetical protein
VLTIVCSGDIHFRGSLLYMASSPRDIATSNFLVLFGIVWLTAMYYYTAGKESTATLAWVTKAT